MEPKQTDPTVLNAGQTGTGSAGMGIGLPSSADTSSTVIMNPNAPNGYKDMGLYIDDPNDPRGEEFDTDARWWQERKDYIETIYREELGRNADPDGLEYWANTDLQGDELVKKIREIAGLDNTLYEDPAYAVYMRNMRQREATIEADRKARAREIENQRVIANAGIDEQQRQGMRNINDSAEARGMYRSGGRISDRADLAKNLAVTRAQTELASTTQQNELNRTAASELASLSRGRDEQEVETRQRLTNQSIQEAAENADL